MKNIIIIAIFLSVSFVNINNISDDPTQPWSFMELNNIILNVFPEAYEDFVTISFYRKK